MWRVWKLRRPSQLPPPGPLPLPWHRWIMWMLWSFVSKAACGKMRNSHFSLDLCCLGFYLIPLFCPPPPHQRVTIRLLLPEWSIAQVGPDRSSCRQKWNFGLFDIQLTFWQDCWGKLKGQFNQMTQFPHLLLVVSSCADHFGFISPGFISACTTVFKYCVIWDIKTFHSKVLK